jgi:hypothetical protein
LERMKSKTAKEGFPQGKTALAVFVPDSATVRR